jgi:hypothetical protein
MVETRELRLNLKAALCVLAALLLSDALMVQLHLLYVRTIQEQPTPLLLDNPIFSLSRDRGVAESVEYLKSAVTIGMFLMVARLGGGKLFTALAAIHGWLLADNMLRLHEHLGEIVGRIVAPNGALGLPSYDIGQPLAVGAVGAGLTYLLWRGWRTSNRQQRLWAGALFCTAAAVLVFGVFVDALHASVLRPMFSETTWLLAEDGGETVVLSLNCALAVGIGLAMGVRLWPASPQGAPAPGE